MVNYRKLLQNNDRNLIDGKSIVILLNRFRKSKVRFSQIRGVDFTREILKTFPTQKSIFLLGSSIENLKRLMEIFKNEYPNLEISGTFSPPYEIEWLSYIDSAIDQIEKARACLVLVSLGTPKQDFVAREIAARLNIVTVSIGAAFDFISLNVPECPKWMQSIGLEWFFRLMMEPRRLWRRYLIESPKIIKLFIVKRI
jgi:N-acetylglucosaminyldiphosphoundecaprenol N-acetyl-beta-D-mannosaminyltransferase